MKHFSFRSNVFTKIIVIFAIITALIVVSIASIVFLLPYYNELQNQLQNQRQNQHQNQQLKNFQTKVINRSDQLYYSRLKLAISILNVLNEEKPNENIFYSPYSVFRVLLLSYFGAAGETEEELKHVLGLDWAKSKKDVANWYKLEKDLRDKRFQNQSFEYLSAEKFYITDHNKISDPMEQFLNGSIEQLDFSSNVNLSTTQINQFIEENTNNQINDFVKPNMIKDAETVIVDAVYFKGLWNHIHSPTFPFTFYGQNGQRFGLNMSVNGLDPRYDFIDHLKTKVVQLPFKGDNQTISMYVLLPENGTMIEDLLKEITPEILDDIFKGVNLKPESMFFQYPEIPFQKEVDLIPAMLRIGLQRSFGNHTNYSDLFAKIEEYESLKIQLKHKVKIEMSNPEIEVKPAICKPRGRARTCIRPKSKNAGMPYVEFICNRPFMFIIHDQKFKEILFFGIFRGPGQ